MANRVCRYYQNGYCRNGANCKFEHPGANQPNNNRFGPLSTQNSNNNSANRKNDGLPYLLDIDLIRRELTEERPIWILSSYGPGRDAPEQLFGGYPREQSFEELRLHYDKGVAAGNMQGVVAEIGGLYQNAEQQIQHVLGNLEAAVRFVVEAADKHPNRIDVVKQGGQGGGGVFVKKEDTKTNAFGGQRGAFAAAGQSLRPFGASSTSNTTTSGFGAAGGFGQPAALGQRTNAFGAPSAPAFGTSSFGQPSQPPAGSAFGQPSKLGGFGAMGAKANPFGTPSNPATTSGFGAPSQPATSSPFGAPSQPAASSPFGQPSKPATPAFGQPSQPGGAANPFGQPKLAQATPAFGTSSFGQPSQPAPSAPSSGFGQPSALGAKPNPFGAPSAGASTAASPFSSTAVGSQAASTPFGSQATTPSPFGSTSAASPGASPFGQPSAPTSFGGQPATSTTFGQSAAPTPSNPFGQPSQPSAAASAAQNPFGAPSATPAAGSNPFASATPVVATNGVSAGPSPSTQDPYPPNAQRKHPPLSSYAQRSADGRLVSWHGQPVAYQQLKPGAAPVPMVRAGAPTGPGKGPQLQRIWFPDGPPAYTAETEVKAEEYDEASKREWAAFVEKGAFVGGKMPLMPPLREFCRWDF